MGWRGGISRNRRDGDEVLKIAVRIDAAVALSNRSRRVAEQADRESFAANRAASTLGLDGHTPIKVVESATNATLPCVLPIAKTPIASGCGNGTVPPKPADSCTRK